ncbi:hypothetical protein E8E11_005453 [Didymella keratinophila]|nr:hypothetical protein E8E11_005453 [Didymella keratinophila]
MAFDTNSTQLQQPDDSYATLKALRHEQVRNFIASTKLHLKETTKLISKPVAKKEEVNELNREVIVHVARVEDLEDEVKDLRSELQACMMELEIERTRSRAEKEKIEMQVTGWGPLIGNAKEMEQIRDAA